VADMTQMVQKSDYDLCDAENSNLRRHLLWAAQFLTHDQKIELRKRISQPIEEGGVTDDELSEGKEISLRRDKAINLLCDYCDTINDDGTASARANNLRAFLSDWSRQPARFIPWGDTDMPLPAAPVDGGEDA